MAIGLGLLFGLGLPINFNAPYGATSIRDFWRRWHMTLSRFLRDYLYIPLGGSRHGPVRQTGAVAVTMLLGGLWHGANWTFVIWGGLHGLALAINHAWSSTGRHLPKGLAWALTMLFVFLGWVLFRAETFTVATEIWSSIFGVNGLSLTLHDVRRPWIIAVGAAVAVLGPTSQRVALEQLTPHRAVAVIVGLALVLVTLQVGGGDNTEFIYFQF
jgi:D-alanyl-lipoteichoic acid acyltransferase DltB (MBOAT superfamily)